MFTEQYLQRCIVWEILYKHNCTLAFASPHACCENPNHYSYSSDWWKRAYEMIGQRPAVMAYCDVTNTYLLSLTGEWCPVQVTCDLSIMDNGSCTYCVCLFIILYFCVPLCSIRHSVQFCWSSNSRTLPQATLKSLANLVEWDITSATCIHCLRMVCSACIPSHPNAADEWVALFELCILVSL